MDNPHKPGSWEHKMFSDFARTDRSLQFNAELERDLMRMGRKMARDWSNYTQQLPHLAAAIADLRAMRGVTDLDELDASQIEEGFGQGKL